MYYLQQLIQAILYPFQALLYSPGKISSGARRLANISLPARISILVFFFLVLASIAAYFGYLQDKGRANFWQNGWYLTALVVLVIVIPIVLYYALRLWLEGDISRYPEIDYAWKAGMAELKAHGIDLQYTPLFLVIGSPGDQVEKSIFSATQLPLRVRDVPTGDAWLHWYADPDGIYLVATKVGCLSRLAALAKQATDEQKKRGARTIPPAPRSPAPTLDMTKTMVQAEPEPMPEADPPSEVVRSVVASQLFPPAQAAPRDMTKTIMAGGDGDDQPVLHVEPKQVKLPQDEQREQEMRLEYLCRLISQARTPLAPINGLMTLLPYSVVQTGRQQGSELQRVVRRDLDTLVGALRLRCPVVSLVIGMEEESGFRELVRRIGREPAIAQRFGKGYSVGNSPIPEQLEAVATHACGLFEGQVYSLFREKGSLAKPGNRKLYALLCKIRRTVREPLTNILVNGYAHDPDVRRDDEGEPFFYSGCYFAATGETEDRQAFIKAVFEKLPAEQEELQWTAAALDDEDRYRRWGQALVWLDGLLLLSLVGLVVYRFVLR